MNALKSGMISLSGSFIQQAISLIGTIIIARILSPEDYGIYGLCFATFVFFQAFLDFGITPIYIKLERVDKTINSSFFTLNILFGSLVSLILILIAPYFAAYYDLPLLKPLLYTQSLIPFLQSMSNQPFGQLLRHQKFFHAEITSVGANFIAMGVGICCALFGLGPWALLYKHMAYNIARISGGLWFSKAKYHFVGYKDLLDIKKFVLQAGHLTAARFATGISGNLEKLLIGKVFGEASLGHFNQSLFICEKPSIFANALTTPAMSYLSRMAKDRYAQSYITLTHVLITLIGLPCLFLFSYGDHITTFILGTKWDEAASYVTYVSFLGLSLILKGLCNIILVNELKTARLFYLNIWSIGIVYPVSLWVLFSYTSLLSFLFVFSLFSLFFWLIVLFDTLYKAHHKENFDLLDFVFIVFLLSVFLLIGSGVKLFFTPISFSIILKIAVSFCFTAIVTLLLSYLFFPKQVQAQIQFVKDRLDSK